mmetsp:Transcript_15607/g.25649  ORF Transcript_15607/g.25649 Transcript_15607/m.25649 type:complete len:159 (-) Transcript_15607:144-620(-)
MMLRFSLRKLVIVIATTCATFTNARSHHPSIALFVDAPTLTKRKDDQQSCRGIFGNIPFMSNNNGDDNNNLQKNQNENESVEGQINKFLDTPLFDPDSESNQENWFANLVKNDYDSAEALYVGIVGIVGVIVSQEMLRIVKYGADNYVPFGHGGGNLF